LLGLRLVEEVARSIPASALDVHTVAEAAVLRFLSHLGRLDLVVDLVLEGELIDGDCVLSSIVLELACEEGLGEEESRYPEDSRWAGIDPFLEEFDSVEKIDDPTC